MTEKHSPLPWTDGTGHNGDPEWIFAGGAVVADCGFFSNDETNRANVQMIVRAVNCLPEAIAALEMAKELIKDAMEYGDLPSDIAFDCGVREIDAALAKLKG